MTDEVRGLRDPELVAAVAAGIVAARDRAGYSRTTFAETLGWARTRLVELELGRREARLVDLERVCVALGVTLRELLGETPRGRAAAEALGLGGG